MLQPELNLLKRAIGSTGVTIGDARHVPAKMLSSATVASISIYGLPCAKNKRWTSERGLKESSVLRRVLISSACRVCTNVHVGRIGAQLHLISQTKCERILAPVRAVTLANRSMRLIRGRKRMSVFCLSSVDGLDMIA